MAGREGPRRYAILQRYASTDYGPWEQGTTVELEPAQAAWVNRDSPGTLAEIDPGVKLETGQPVPASKLKGYRPVAPPAATAATAAAVRTWARSQGLDVPDRGKVPDAVVEAYAAAHAVAHAAAHEEP